MYLFVEKGEGDVSPDDSLGVETTFGVPVYRTVPDFMSKISDPDDVVRFGEKFGQAIAVFKEEALKAHGGGDPLRHMPFVTQHNATVLEFIFKAENNGNTYRVVDEFGGELQGLCNCEQCVEARAAEG